MASALVTAGNLALAAMNRVPDVWNCRILEETSIEATLSFETEKGEWPEELEWTLKDYGMTLIHAEVSDWLS
ncbi:hypothetical protein [Lysobacter sp. Hz 25]|uniref:hypothetical protein n=1 Tax=Lysobacter sp. Hz 25 TaxID=3383698 RepID=UPI0038D35555